MLTTTQWRVDATGYETELDYNCDIMEHKAVSPGSTYSVRLYQDGLFYVLVDAEGWLVRS